MKKLLIISNKLDIGGVQRALISFVDALVRDGWGIDLVLFDRQGELEPLLPQGVRVVSFPKELRWLYIPRGEIFTSFLHACKKPLNGVKYLFYLTKGVLTKNMEASRQQLQRSVLSSLPEWAGEYDAAIDYAGRYKSFILSRVRARKKLSWLHGDYRTFGRSLRIDAEDYANIDAIVNVSKSCEKILLEHFPTLRDKCRVIPNITSKTAIRNLALQSSAFDDDACIHILDVARLDFGKGLEIAIDACRMLVNRGYAVKWYIAGDGPLKKTLHDLIARNHLENHFCLLGQLPNPYPYIASCDIFVHCSLSEGRSVAVDEAMLLERPILLTDYPTAADQITSDKNGLICETTPEALCAAIARLIDNPDQRRRYSSALASFDIPAENSLNVFRNIINDKNQHDGRDI